MPLSVNRAAILYCFLFICPLFAFAQKKDSTLHKWELGLGFGVSGNSVQSAWANHSFSHTINFASQVSIARNFGKHFQVGAEVCPTTIAYKGKAYEYVLYGGALSTNTLVYRVVIGNPVLPMCLFGNYYISIKGLKIYAGLAAGYVVTTINKSNKDVFYDKTKDGTTFGGQIGIQEKLTKRLSVYMEVDLRNVSLHETAIYYSYLPSPLYYYSGVAGLRYCF